MKNEKTTVLKNDKDQAEFNKPVFGTSQFFKEEKKQPETIKLDEKKLGIGKLDITKPKIPQPEIQKPSETTSLFKKK
jgi:hypothetical protein